MGKYISLGAYYSVYKYLWIFMALYFIEHFIYQENFIFEKWKNNDFKIPYGYFVQYFLDSFGVLILSIILTLIEKKFVKNEENQEKKEKKDSDSEYLLHSGDNTDKLSYKNIQKSVILNVFFIVLVELFTYIMASLQFFVLYFWSLEILGYSLINSKLSNSKIYRHQWVSIIFIIIFCTSIQIAIMIITFQTENYKNSLLYGNSSLIALGFFSMLIVLFGEVFFLSRAKYFFDMKYVSVSRYLFFYGSVGLIVSLICGIISTFIPCFYEKPNNIVEAICFSEDIDKKYRYFDSFYLYFKELYNNGFVKKLFILILRMIIIPIIDWLCCLIYKNLTPIHFFFGKHIIDIFILILNLIDDSINKVEDQEIFVKSSILDIISVIFYIIGVIVYLEMVELKFCELNHDVKKNIINRGVSEVSDDIGLISEMNLVSEI